MQALLIVDVQKDFCPGGALPAPQGNIVVPVINSLIDKFDTIIASKDWHPEDSVHFEKWPPHCVKDTPGAEFHSDLQAEKIQQLFLKGTGNKDDGYSAFEATNKNLDNHLKENHIEELYITGLTTEYCVKNTAIDAVENSYKTYVVTNGVEGVKAHEEDEMNAYREMQMKGAHLIHSNQVK